MQAPLSLSLIVGRRGGEAYQKRPIRQRLPGLPPGSSYVRGMFSEGLLVVPEVNLALRQYFLEPLDAFIGDLSSVKLQPLKLLMPFKKSEPSISDFRSEKVQIDEMIQPLEMF